MKIALFDVCGTIFHSNTTFDFLEYYLKNNKTFRVFNKIRKSIILKITNHLIYKLTKIDLMRLIATRFLNGSSLEDIQKASKEFVKILVKYKLNKQIYDLIVQYKNAGYHIVLFSGSYSFIVEEVMKLINADAFYASSLKIKDNVVTGKYDKDILLKKKEIFKKEYKQYSDLVVVTDNKTDLDLIEIATKGFIVSKKKNKNFWLSKKLNHIELLEV
ncbi:HAD phosphoserine phosphatase-like hydrolase, IB family protein [Geobacillus kaustophilus]|uniref:HAD phosphoserine phosphatase-like hydrolase, IB family protein n=1 Tax=Geobacillus kaustophilus TaxID=1462 RepID=A0A0D8BX76_GEOKU|nr:HAD-IB family phosphatase [Geobacillus kaustophilus]KJE27992.1 HAD phosphoserine phosphatase-like hydrolase, IB family protein [Geobacillus kaustophilus]